MRLVDACLMTSRNDVIARVLFLRCFPMRLFALIEDLASCEAFLSKTGLDQYRLGNLMGQELARLLQH